MPRPRTRRIGSDATLADVPRRRDQPGDVSLSPETFRTAGDLSRVVLPSPNGSTICAILAEAGVDVLVACAAEPAGPSPRT